MFRVDVRERELVVDARAQDEFPTSAGILLGLGLGGFFDGIVLHQLLQWHHMLTSAGVPADTVRNLEINTFLDGLFHAATYVFVVAGLAVLWRHAQRPHRPWSGRLLFGTLLMGFGLFNLLEGLVNHHILGLHHVNETVPVAQRIYWDIGFLLWGAVMLGIGWRLKRAGRSATAAAPMPNRRREPSAPRVGGRRFTDPRTPQVLG